MTISSTSTTPSKQFSTRANFKGKNGVLHVTVPDDARGVLRTIRRVINEQKSELSIDHAYIKKYNRRLTVVVVTKVKSNTARRQKDFRGRNIFKQRFVGPETKLSGAITCAIELDASLPQVQRHDVPVRPHPEARQRKPRFRDNLGTAPRLGIA